MLGAKNRWGVLKKFFSLDGFSWFPTIELIASCKIHPSWFHCGIILTPLVLPCLRSHSSFGHVPCKLVFFGSRIMKHLLHRLRRREFPGVLTFRIGVVNEKPHTSTFAGLRRSIIP
jgi:hypothetical protein